MSEEQAQRRLPGLPAMAGYGVAGIAAVVTLLFAGLVAYVAMYDAPYWDLWTHINRDSMLTDLFSRNNEHPVVINRILYWIDDWAFSASSRFVQAITLLALAGQVMLLAWLAKLAGIKRPVLAIAPAAIVFVFYPFGFENTIWIFQVSMVLAFTSAAGALVCFAAHVQRDSMPALIGSLVFSVLAVLSFANGVLVPTLLVPVALWLRPRAVFGFAMIAVVAWAWQLSASGTGSGAMPPAFDKVVVHFLTQLGAPIGWAAGYLSRLGVPLIDNLQVALQVGVLVVIMSALALGFIALRASRSPAMIACMGLVLFALATAGLIALSRHAMGSEQALSSRYNVNSALLYATLLVVAISAVEGADESILRWISWASAILAAPLFVISITSAPIFQDLAGRYRGALEGETALVAGVRDTESVGQLSFDYDMAARESAEFRKHHTWIFADRVSRRVGEPLAVEEMKTPFCTGSSWKVSVPDADAGFRKAQGVLPRQPLSHGAVHVLIADARNTIVGYGRVPRRPSDLNPFVQRDGADIDWVGRIQPNAAAPFTAYLGDDNEIRCSLGMSAS